MPTQQNITQPVILTCTPGRSGTSLVQDIFRCHPEFEICGETLSFLCGIWMGAATSSMAWSKGPDGKYIPQDEQYARSARAAFLAAFDGGKPRWFHKPCGIPKNFHWKSLAAEDEFRGFPYAWYWKVFEKTFPDAKYFSVLRHPFDIVLSRVEYSQWGQAGIWYDLGIIAEMLLHPDCKVENVLFYDDLVSDPKGTVCSLFEFLDIPFYEQCMDAFKTLHVSKPGADKVPMADREREEKGDFSRRDQWDRIDRKAIDWESLEKIRQVWEKFGRELDVDLDAGQEAS